MYNRKNPAFVIMAAGMGLRYAGGIKQLEPVGSNGEIIIDYSIHDAIQAGFRKIIFVIRKDIEKDFREVIGNRIEKECAHLGVSFYYAFQKLKDLPKGFKLPNGRTKPWGTGQAVLSCKDIIKEPFVVINADDYYGKEAFIKLCNFLKQDNLKKNQFCMAGFVLKNTLSDNGAVTRGICQLNDQNYLEAVLETQEIICKDNVIKAGEKELDPCSDVCGGLTSEFVEMLEEGFCEFLERISQSEQKAEFLLPIFIDQMLQ